MGESHEERSLVPGGETGVTPFGERPITLFSERFSMPPLHRPLIPLSEAEQSKLASYYNDALLKLGNLETLTQQADANSLYRLLSELDIQEALDSVRMAQEVGLNVVPFAARNLLRKQAILTERFLQYFGGKTKSPLENYVIPDRWPVGFHRGIQRAVVSALTLQLERTAQFLKEGYLAPDIEASAPDDSREQIRTLNEEQLNATFDNLIKYCLYPEIPLDYENEECLHTSVKMLKEMVIATSEWNLSLSFRLLKQWQESIDLFSVAFFADQGKHPDRLVQKDSFVLTAKAYAEALSTLLRIVLKQGDKQNLQKFSDEFILGGSWLPYGLTIFDMTVDVMGSLSSLTKRARTLLREFGERERGLYQYEFYRDQRILAYLIKLALYERSSEERIDELVDKFTESVLEQQEHPEVPLDPFDRQELFDEDLGEEESGDDNPEIQSDETSEPTQDDEQYVIEKICSFLTPREQKKFLAMGW